MKKMKQPEHFKIRSVETIFGACGFLCLFIFCLISVLAPWLSPHALDTSFFPFLSPSWQHPLGTNDMGYDIFSELLHSSRVSLIIGLVAASISAFIGSLIGIVSGYFRGIMGEMVTGAIDLFLLIPALPLMIILASYLGASIWNIVFVIVLLGWCSTARAVRAKTLKLRELPFIDAMIALDIPVTRILSRHILPNVMEIISAKFVVSVAGAMLSEASLSFLGLGDPTKVSWGTMMHYAFKRGGFANGMWFWYLPPGLCIAVCAMSFVLIGLYFSKRDNGAIPWWQ
ncbi:ABC transporter permease [bacterium]|nr:ABC transporter permease [bacterium]